MVRYPNANPFVHSKVERTEDGWYRGEDCASPSEAAPSAKHPVLPAADGSLALKADAVLPGAPPGREKFGDGLETPRSGLGPFPKHADAMGKKAIDYRQESVSCPDSRRCPTRWQTPERGTC